MKKFLLDVLLLTLSGILYPIFGQWSIHTIDPDLYRATIVDVADIDGDGDLDVAATSYVRDMVVWYENDQLNWIEHPIDPFLDGAVGVYVADIDGDDTLDVVAAGESADRVVWYKNSNASQTWTKYTIDTDLYGAKVVYVDDVDGDGDPDVVATGTNANAVVWYENVLPDTNWHKYPIDENLGGAMSCHVADINGDDTLDVVATGNTAHDVIWYENGGGTPINWTPHPIDTYLLGALYVVDADLDEDNNLDLVATGKIANDVVWYKNSGGTPITWTKYIIDSDLYGADIVDIADIDLDSDLDVFATGTNANDVVWYENVLPDPNWPKYTIDGNLNAPFHIYAVDIDDDSDSDAVVAGLNKVVWYENPLITSIELHSDLAPTGYLLSQNYPNPFNPTTTIQFDLPKRSEVNLKVFNILGEEVTTLVSDRLSAGSYSYEWDARNLASGVYLYRLQASDYIETRKMVLMR